MVEGVQVIPLLQIPDERGKVMRMLRHSDPHFQEFGEVYFSVVFPGVVKGWHRHRRMTINYAVPFGRIKLVLYDDRPNSTSRGVVQEIFLGQDNYSLVQVPPLIWNGFTGYGTTEAIVCNCASIIHDPEEIERLDPFSPQIPYNWSLKNR